MAARPASKNLSRHLSVAECDLFYYFFFIIFCVVRDGISLFCICILGGEMFRFSFCCFIFCFCSEIIRFRFVFWISISFYSYCGFLGIHFIHILSDDCLVNVWFYKFASAICFSFCSAFVSSFLLFLLSSCVVEAILALSIYSILAYKCL